MKLLSVATLVAAAVAVANAQTPPANQPALYALILSIDSQKLAEKLLELVFGDAPDTPEPEDPTAQAAEWASKCITGQFSYVPPAVTKMDPVALGFDPSAFSNVDFTNPTTANTEEILKALKKIVAKVKIEAKIFFVSDAETMALPECAASKVDGLFRPLAGFSDIFGVAKYEPVTADSTAYNTCVTENADGTVKPVCGDYSETAQPDEYKAAQQCAACSVTSNSILASTVAAAAFVAMALFF